MRTAVSDLKYQQKKMKEEQKYMVHKYDAVKQKLRDQNRLLEKIRNNSQKRHRSRSASRHRDQSYLTKHRFGVFMSLLKESLDQVLCMQDQALQRDLQLSKMMLQGHFHPGKQALNVSASLHNDTRRFVDLLSKSHVGLCLDYLVYDDERLPQFDYEEERRAAKREETDRSQNPLTSTNLGSRASNNKSTSKLTNRWSQSKSAKGSDCGRRPRSRKSNKSQRSQKSQQVLSSKRHLTRNDNRVRPDDHIIIDPKMSLPILNNVYMQGSHEVTQANSRLDIEQFPNIEIQIQGTNQSGRDSHYSTIEGQHVAPGMILNDLDS